MTNKTGLTDINLLQLNLNRTKLAQDDISRRIGKINIKNPVELFIFCIQEPYIFKKQHARRPLSCKVFCAKENPRTAIYCHEQLQNTWFIESLSNRDCTVIQTRINKKDTIIASIYLDITNTEVIPNWLYKLTKYVKDNRTAILICMDSNCHSSSFGNDTNKRGEKLDEFIAENLLSIENIGKEFTYETSNAKSIIDITLSANLSVSVTNWTVTKENNFTDHNTITFKLRIDQITLPACRKWDKTNWEIFKKELDSRSVHLRENITPQRMEKALEKFYININVGVHVSSSVFSYATFRTSLSATLATCAR